jgi:hypothetical protein
MQKDGSSLLLPEGLLNYFELLKVEEKGKRDQDLSGRK